MLYDDGRIACDDDFVIIRRYYAWGSAKSIPYEAMHSVTRRALTEMGGKWRIWGSNDLVHWWNFDPGRPKKESALVIDVGKRFLPTVTPDHPDDVERILAEHGVKTG